MYIHVCHTPMSSYQYFVILKTSTFYLINSFISQLKPPSPSIPSTPLPLITLLPCPAQQPLPQDSQIFLEAQHAATTDPTSSFSIPLGTDPSSSFPIP